MSPSVHPNFYELCAAAEKVMPAPRVSAPATMRDGWRTILRIRHYPSFEPNFVWDIAIGDDSEQASVCELKWDRPSDARRFFEPLYGLAHELKLRPVPELTMRYAMLREPVLRTIERFYYRSVQIKPPAGVVLDGNHWYVEFYEQNECVLDAHWWLVGTREDVEPLKVWTGQLVALLREALDGAPVARIVSP